MSEIIPSINPEIRSETHGRITVIFDPHASQENFDKGEPMWRPKVYEEVAKINPFVIGVDSIESGYTRKDIDQIIPVENPSLLERGSHVIGADVTALWSESDNPMVNQGYWEQIMKAVIKFDPAFDPTTQRTSSSEMLLQQFAIEESVVSAGLAALTTSILWRVYKNRKETHQPRQFTRRDFLKLAVAGGAVATAKHAQKAFFFDHLMRTQVTDGAPIIDQVLVRATKPILHKDPWNDIRDAKVGLAVMSRLNHPGWSEKKAVIIFGNGHAIDEYPGQKSNETLEEAIERLLDVMRHGFEAIIKNNQNGPDAVPPEVMGAALTEIFATRDTYLPIKNQWVKIESDLIPEVAYLIEKVIKDKYDLP